jgi:hypothetical protein
VLVDLELKFPLDEDGFLRRGCPNCEREFKWFDGATAETPEDFMGPDRYYCPYCGVPAALDSWWTKNQLDFIERAAAGPVLEHVADELSQAFRSASSRSRGGLRFEQKAISLPEPPLPLVESNDMSAVASPCHSFEPIKITESWTDLIYCLVCGRQFRL